MGYELNKLMKQYGVATPTMASVAPQMPGKPPVESEYTDAEGSPGNAEKYAADKAAFDESVRKYGLAQEEYDRYQGAFQNRLANTNMYNQAQFSTTGANVPGAMNYVPQEDGNMKFERVSREPGTQYGTPQWTDTVRAPSYGVAPMTLAGQPMQENADWYLGQRGIGYTDADLRSGYEKTFGPIDDASWSNITGYYPQNSGTMADLANWNVNDPLRDQKLQAARAIGWNESSGLLPGEWAKQNNLTGLYQVNKYATTGGKAGTLDGWSGGGYVGDQNIGQLFQKYAKGGAVKGYNQGGLEDRGITDPETGVTVYPIPAAEPITSRPLYNDPVLEGAAQAIDRADDAAEPAPAPAVAPIDDRSAALQTMLERYGPQDIDYSGQIGAARERQVNEQRAFEEMLRAQLDSPEDADASKAEMYFRLAAAFGAPTKTGHFTENLSMAGKEMAETAKGRRESRARKLGVQMELQKMRMGAANKELDALRALGSEGMRDRRAIAQELIRDYIQSGRPQSTAGKTALDMGLQPGTPEYQAKVQELTELQIQREMEAINAQVASTAATTARAGQMSPTEINLRTETENNLANINQAINDVREAYRLNPNSYAGGWLEKGQRWLYEVAGSDDPKIVNTRRIDNLLGAQALGSLRAIFGGNPTEGERNILLDMQGIGSKSLEERRQIMLRLYEVLQDRQARGNTRLQNILSGAYRSYAPLEGGQ